MELAVELHGVGRESENVARLGDDSRVAKARIQVVVVIKEFPAGAIRQFGQKLSGCLLTLRVEAMLLARHAGCRRCVFL